MIIVVAATSDDAIEDGAVWIHGNQIRHANRGNPNPYEVS